MSEFEYETLKEGDSRCLLGITGFSHSGKTYSAVRLALGAQRVYGGDVAVIDSEEAAGMYAKRFPNVKRVRLAPPWDAGRWHRAIDYAYQQGARAIVLDTLSDEHIAMMEKHEEVLQRMAGDDWKKRERCQQAAFANRDVKPLRAKMERRIWELSKTCCIIVLWRADQKYTPKQKHETQHVDADDHTWKMATTSKLMYLCVLRWLLKPGSDGQPELQGTNDAEKQLIKVPEPFRKLQMAKQLDEALGEQIAMQCKYGDSAKPAAARVYTISKGDKSADRQLTEAQAENYRKQGYTVVLSEAERAEDALNAESAA